MIVLDIRINNWLEVGHIKAVRIHPTDHKPDEGEMCTYEMSYYNNKLGKLKFPYGDGLDLGIEMIKFIKEHKVEIEKIQEDFEDG